VFGFVSPWVGRLLLVGQKDRLLLSLSLVRMKISRNLGP